MVKINSTLKVDSSGIQRWRTDEGYLHREDGPAIIYPNGDQVWFLNGVLDRPNGPAVVRTDGSIEYFRRWKKMDPLEVFLIAGQQKVDI